jgi:hypothetical protein
MMEQFLIEPVELVELTDAELDAVAGGAVASSAQGDAAAVSVAAELIAISIPLTAPPITINGANLSLSLGVG